MSPIHLPQNEYSLLSLPPHPPLLSLPSPPCRLLPIRRSTRPRTHGWRTPCAGSRVIAAPRCSSSPVVSETPKSRAPRRSSAAASAGGLREDPEGGHRHRVGRRCRTTMGAVSTARRRHPRGGAAPYSADADARQMSNSG
jgi:hypothetical protein